MKCHLLPSGTRIEPFGDAVGRVPIANRELADWQRQVLAACGLQLVDDGETIVGPCLVLADDLFITRGLLQAFVGRCDSAPPSQPTVLLLRDSAQLKQNAALQGLQLEHQDDERASARLPLWFLPAGASAEPPPMEDCQAIEIVPKEKLLRLPVPEHYFGQSELLVPLTQQAAMRIRHWAHLLAVNRLAWALDQLDRPRWRLWLSLAWALLRAVIPTRRRVLQTTSRVGKGCEVHPTAVLEGAILEDGAKVGPFAVVRFSRVGKGAWVQGHAQVTLSVLGDKTLVSAGSTVNLCLTWPEASASQILMQLCVLGRRAITTGGGFTMDMRFDRDVQVVHQGRPQSVGTRFLGAAVGHDAVLGTGFWLAPGRAIPNGAVVIRHPDQVVRKVPASVEPGTLLVPQDGRLVPLEPKSGPGED